MKWIAYVKFHNDYDDEVAEVKMVPYIFTSEDQARTYIVQVEMQNTVEDIIDSEDDEILEQITIYENDLEVYFRGMYWEWSVEPVKEFEEDL